MGDPQPSAADRLDEAVLLAVLSDVRSGDSSVRMPLEWTGVAGKIADRLNDVIAANRTLEGEPARVSRAVGKEGRLSHRVAFRGADQVAAGERQRCIEAGASAYVSKPVDTAELLLVLREWLPAAAANAGSPAATR